MNIHEHQAKEVLAKFGAPVLKGGAAFSVDEAVKIAEDLGGPVWVVKSQIHAGGRGLAGGVKVVKSIDEVRAEADRMLGLTLVTHQTGPEGKEVRRLYIEDGCMIADEFYFSMLVDRATSNIAIIASTEGGMDIETVADESPEKIITIQIDPASGIMPHHLRDVSFGLGLSGDTAKQCQKVVANMYKAFVAKDCAMLEVNPLVVTQSGDIVVLDAKVSFDGNALYRHPDILELRDLHEEDEKEIEASKHELNYVALDGNIGCMVNGAGLAMATMDIIKLKGAEPANFLDVGGGATRERVTEAFKLILSDPQVEGILVNIFGGIMRCDVIADGVVHAARDLHLNKPLVVRLEGTNVEKGKEILNNSGLAIVAADDLNDAAVKIVAAVKEAK